jgi:hypothetical protein
MKTDLVAKNKATLTGLMKPAHVGKTVRYRGKNFRIVECHGEAHSNPFIDHCMVCLPYWGVYAQEIKDEPRT